MQKGTRPSCPLSPLLLILVLEILNRDVRRDERIMGLKIKKESYKLRAFEDDSVMVLVLADPLRELNF